MDRSCPSGRPSKLVGDKVETRPHQAAHFRARGRRSAFCNLAFMLVIVLIYLIAHNLLFARAQFYTVAILIMSRTFSKFLCVSVFSAPPY
jgi:hypothetical protein